SENNAQTEMTDGKPSLLHSSREIVSELYRRGNLLAREVLGENGGVSKASATSRHKREAAVKPRRRALTRSDRVTALLHGFMEWLEEIAAISSGEGSIDRLMHTPTRH
ncbi:hypothetical protein FOZ62_028838, partial [Perkinsus olseni]